MPLAFKAEGSGHKLRNARDVTLEAGKGFRPRAALPH